MPHITDYRVALAIGIAVMAVTYYAFRLLENWLTKRVDRGDSSTQE